MCDFVPPVVGFGRMLMEANGSTILTGTKGGAQGTGQNTVTGGGPCLRIRVTPVPGAFGA